MVGGTFEAKLVMSVVYVLIDYLIFKRKMSISSRNVDRIIRFINKPIAHRSVKRLYHVCCIMMPRVKSVPLPLL